MLETTPKLLLVDNDPFFLSTLKRMVEDLDYIISQTCTTYESALQATEKAHFDLALLDINMGSRGVETEEGIVLGKRLQKKSMPFIYITGLDDKAIIQRAARSQPAAYLLKPINEIQLFSAIQLAFENHAKTKVAEPEMAQAIPNYFFVKIGQTMQRIEWKSVYGLRAIKNYVEVLCHHRSVALPVRGTLKAFLAAKLPEVYREDFVRINRSELLHKDVIQHLEKDEILTPYGTFSTTRSRLVRQVLPK